MRLYVMLGIYSLLTLGFSLLGGYLPMIINLTHTRAQMMMTFVAGLMLGVALFVMLPHAAMGTQDLDLAILWMTVGLLVMFFLLRTFHFHQHGPQATTPESDHPDGVLPFMGSSCGHDHDHDHGHAHPGEAHSTKHRHQWSWVGVGVGLALHTLLDGVALGASVRTDFDHGHALLPGFATLLAVVLHKPLDAMAITTLMAAGGWKLGWRQLVNCLFGLMCPLGIGLFLFSLGRIPVHENLAVGCILGFSAGIFLSISLGDLLPEIQFHSHDRIKLSLLLLLGVSTAYGTSLLDRQSHSHHMPTSESSPEEQDKHDEHDAAPRSEHSHHESK